MKRLVPFGVLLLMVHNASADDAAKKLLADLQGNFVPATMTKSGEPAPPEILKTVSFIIKDDAFTVSFKKGKDAEDKAATIVLDVKQKPVAIDLTPKDGPEAGKPMLGIIKLEKDTVTLCWNDRTDTPTRPKEFASTKENKQFLIVMVRKR